MLRLRKEAKGFTLIELLISIAIFGLVATAIYNVFIQSMKTTESQRLTSMMQQDARAGIEYITRELNMMGYDIAACSPSPCNVPASLSGSSISDTDIGPKLALAKENEIVFVYKDITETPADYRLVRYFQNGSKIERETWLWKAAAHWSDGHSSDPLIDNVESSGLKFYYYDVDNNALSMPLSYDDRDKVRRIKVVIKTKQSKPDPISKTQKTYTLETEVAVINMGTTTAANTTPPPAPTITAVNPVNICGTLDVKWTASVAADLAGYVMQVETGGSTRQYTAMASSTAARLGGLVTSVSEGGVSSSVYPIAHNVLAKVKMMAFDTGGNYSGWSNEMSATPNANVPNQPLGLDATADTINGSKVDLTWTDNSASYAACAIDQTECDNDVVGYRVYRRVYGTGSWNLLADNDTDSNDWVEGTSYENSIEVSNRCTMFEYKVSAINRCDNSLVSADSATAYGDGGGSIVDVPHDGITNTRASDSTPPAAPVITSRKAGYRRDYLNWNNPGDEDLASIMIRYNKACGIVVVAPPASADAGTPVEDVAGGILTPEAPNATGRSFTHSGTFGGDPSLGDLCPDNIATYGYSLFAFDKCGSPSAYADAAVTTVAQCGEAVPTDDPRYKCQEGAPRWDDIEYVSTKGTSCVGTTSADFTVSDSCGVNNDFAWNRINDSPDNVWDMAGFYIYRKDGTAPWTPSSGDIGTKLNTSPKLNPGSGAVEWTDGSLGIGAAQTLDDSTNVGNTYKYYVIPIDCNRETNLSGNPWVSVALSPTPVPAASNVVTVTPGRITFNNPKPNPLTTYPEPSNPQLTTGQLTIGASPNYTPTSTTAFLHNNVALNIYNTSAGKVKLDRFNLSWVTSAAYLDRVELTRADGVCVWGTAADLSTINCTTEVSNARQQSPATISPSYQLNGISGASCSTQPCTLAMKLTFTDSVGTATANQDMRNVTLNVSDLRYTKTYENGSGEFTATCDMANPRNYLSANDDIIVPSGPIVLNGGGINIQEQKSDGSFLADASQIAGGHNISSANSVKVVAQIDDTSGSGISQAVLYWKETSQATTTPPAASYNAISMSLTSSSGNTHTYTTSSDISIKKDKRIWYYILAKDNKGNWDRAPEYSDTVNAFTYDQDNPCDSIPKAPTFLTLLNSPNTDVDGSGKVNLSWTAVTENTDASTINDLAGYRVYESTSTNKGVAWSAYSLVDTVSNSTTSYARDASAISTGTWLKYQITAIDECSPTPKESAASNVAGPVIKGTCAVKPLTSDFSSYTLDGTSTWIQTLTWTIPVDADKDLKEFNIYSINYCGGPDPCSAIDDVGYTLRGTVTMSNNNTTCSTTGGACAVAGGAVTLTAPVNQWPWAQYWSVRTFDYCGNGANRIQDW